MMLETKKQYVDRLITEGFERFSEGFKRFGQAKNENVRLRRTEKEDQGLDRANESQAAEAPGDAIVIAGAINNLADAIREHARAMRGEEESTIDEQYDLAGEPI